MELYEFNVAGIVASLPCVRLLLDGTSTDPCSAAGGTATTRLATLIEAEPAESNLSQGGPIATLVVCNAILRLTVLGIGITSAPAYTPC